MPPGEFNSSILIKWELISQMVFVLSRGNPLHPLSFLIKYPILIASCYFLSSPAGHSCHISYLQLQVTMCRQPYPVLSDKSLLSIDESHCFISGGKNRKSFCHKLANGVERLTVCTNGYKTKYKEWGILLSCQVTEAQSIFFIFFLQRLYFASHFNVQWTKVERVWAFEDKTQSVAFGYGSLLASMIHV